MPGPDKPGFYLTHIGRFLMGWCRWGRRSFPIFLFFFAFSFFFHFSSFFFVFCLFSWNKANDCSLLGKWGISLRPLELPDHKKPKRKLVLGGRIGDVRLNLYSGSADLFEDSTAEESASAPVVCKSSQPWA